MIVTSSSACCRSNPLITVIMEFDKTSIGSNSRPATSFYSTAR